jgi:hypothetical protein
MSKVEHEIHFTISKPTGIFSYWKTHKNVDPFHPRKERSPEGTTLWGQMEAPGPSLDNSF